MKKKYISLLIIFVFVGFDAVPCMGSWRELNSGEEFITKTESGQTNVYYICYQSDGTIFYADTVRHLLRVKKTDGKVLEYNSEPPAHYSRLYEIAQKDEVARHEWFENEPVLFKVSNMRSYDGGVVLFHKVPRIGRVVQFVDDNLKVTGFWEDKTFSGHLLIPEPVTVTSAGEVVARGEKGEIVKHDMSGKVVKRFVISGLFNESRVIKPEPVTEFQRISQGKNIWILERRNQDIADGMTARLISRDKILPKPKFIIGPEMPSFVKAVEVVQDGTILVMDDYKVFEIDPSTAKIKILKIKGLDFDNDEKMIGMRINGPYLSILSEKRMLTVMISPGIIADKQIPLKFLYERIAWDTIPPASIGSVLFLNKSTDSIEKIEF